MLNLKRVGDEISIQQSTAGLFITAGIQEDIKLETAKIKMTPTGTEVFEVTFLKDNKKGYMTEWLHPEDATEQQEKVAGRILCVLKAFLPKEAIDNLEAKDITDLANKAVIALNATKDSTLLRVKFVYIKDKVTVPRYSKFTWIEPMSVAKADSKIQWLSMDSMTPEVATGFAQKDQKK